MNIKCALSIVSMLILSMNLSEAALLDSVKANPDKKGIIEVCGDIGGRKNNRFVSIFAVAENNENPEYIGCEELSYDGKYNHELKLKRENGVLKITAVSNELCETKTIMYASSEWIDKNIYEKIADGTLSGDTLAETVKEYDSAMGLDLSDIESERDRNILAERIVSARGDFKEKLNEVIANVRAEIALLNGLENANHWSQAEKIIKDSASLTGIDLSKYNRVSDKSKVITAVMNKQYNSYDDLKDNFNAAVANVLNVGTSGSSGGSGGGSKGSSKSVFEYPSNWRDTVSDIVNVNEKYGFVDLDSVPWAKEAINTLYAKQIINGISNTEFAPERFVTREEFVKLAVLAFGFEAEGKPDGFEDVDESRWSYKYIACANQLDIVNGVTNTRFSPEEAITREDMAVILNRCIKLKGVELNEKKADFTDWSSISDYAKEAVGLFAGAGYMNGKGNNIFEPKAPATRAETAKVIYEIVKEGLK